MNNTNHRTEVEWTFKAFRNKLIKGSLIKVPLTPGKILSTSKEFRHILAIFIIFEGHLSN